MKIKKTFFVLSFLAFMLPLSLFAVLEPNSSLFVKNEVNNECLDLSSVNLKYGFDDSSTNGEVLKLQKFLVSLNLLQSGAPNGYFGNGTLSGVKKFQSQNGLQDTGFAGPLTRAKIKEITCGNSLSSVKTEPIKTTATTKTTLNSNGNFTFRSVIDPIKKTVTFFATSNSSKIKPTLVTGELACDFGVDVYFVGENISRCSGWTFDLDRSDDGVFQKTLQYVNNTKAMASIKVIGKAYEKEKMIAKDEDVATVSPTNLDSKSDLFLNITSPKGGEEWKLGDIYSINWDYSGFSAKRINDKIDVYLVSEDNQKIFKVASNVSIFEKNGVKIKVGNTEDQTFSLAKLLKGGAFKLGYYKVRLVCLGNNSDGAKTCSAESNKIKVVDVLTQITSVDSSKLPKPVENEKKVTSVPVIKPSISIQDPLNANTLWNLGEEYKISWVGLNFDEKKAGLADVELVSLGGQPNVKVAKDVVVSGGQSMTLKLWGEDVQNGVSVNWSEFKSGKYKIRVSCQKKNYGTENNCFAESAPINIEPFTIECFANPSSPRVGQVVTLKAIPPKKDLKYYFNWFGSEGLGDSGNPVMKVYREVGLKNVNVSVISEKINIKGSCKFEVTE